MEPKFLRIIDKDIIIPGLEKSYTIIQISDPHLIVVDENSTSEHIQKAKEYETAWQEVKKGFAELFGEPCGKVHEISTVSCFEKVMDFVKEEKPDLLILSGDVLNHEHEEGIRYFTEYMKEYAGEWLFVPGNHDNDIMLQKLEIEGIQIHEMDGVRVIGLDDSRMTLSSMQLEQLKDKLSDQNPSILVMHVPLETELNTEDFKMLGNNFTLHRDRTDDSGREFIALCENPSVPIKAVLCGHIHGYVKSYLIQGREQICCSSGMVGFVHRITVRGN